MYRALLVCNSRFPKDSTSLAELRGPKVDGTVLSEALTDLASGMFERSELRLLLEAESAEIIAEIEEHFGKAEPDDVLLFYYSGHGYSSFGELYLCAVNTRVNSPYATAVSGTVLAKIISKCRAQVKIIILDCCYSGGFKGANELTKELSGTGRYVIAATSATDRAKDADANCDPSPFTKVLADGLISYAVDRNGDLQVDLDDLWAYLANAKFDGHKPHRNYDGAGSTAIARRSPDSSSMEATVGPDTSTAERARTDVPTAEFDEGTSFLEQTVKGAKLSPSHIHEFRQGMRDEMAAKLPPDLASDAFLRRAGLMRDGYPTLAGVLLFGENPTALLADAMVRCVRFHGTLKADSITSHELHGTVPELIVGARDFVAQWSQVGEMPSAASAYSEPVYRFPMIAVREVIANAVVHRDYARHDVCVQVHVFDDRIEVINPGTWGARQSVSEGQVPLATFQQHSQSRNFRLALVLTWAKLVESVGAGLPRAVGDCHAVGSPDPMVAVEHGVVTVTIFPGDTGKHHPSNPPDLPRQPVTSSLPAAITPVGREAELQQILRSAESGPGASVVTIVGMAGVGKTTVALRAAARLANRYPDGQFFVDLSAHVPGRDHEQPSDVLAKLLVDVGTDPRHIPDEPDNRRAMWRNWTKDKRILLVLDDAADKAQVESVLPAGRTCLTLVTSRRRIDGLSDSRPLSLNVLAAKSAAELLSTVAGRVPTDDAERRAMSLIARLCGYLPLAIMLMGSRLAHHPNWTITDLDKLVREIQSATDRLAELDNYEQTVRAAFDLSYQDLPPSDQLLFRRLALHPGPHLDAYVAAALAGVDIDRAARTLRALADHHLLGETMRGRYRLHDLLRDYARTLVSTDNEVQNEIAVNRLLDYYLRTAANADRWLRPIRHNTVNDTERAAKPTEPIAVQTFTCQQEALAWLRAERPNLLACLEYTIGRNPVWAMALTRAISGLLVRDGPWREARRLHQQAAATAQSLKDRTGEANALADLGLVCSLTGEYSAAAERFRQALSLYRETADRVGEATVLSNLGNVCRETGDYLQAADRFGQALSLYRETGNLPGEAKVIGNLGVLRRETGDYDAAAELFEQTLSLSRRLGDQLTEAAILGNLGTLHSARGDFAAAADLLQQALSLFRELGSSLGEANALGNLGVLRRETGDYDAAAELFEQALTLSRELGSSLGEANALGNLGVLRRETGDFAAATEMLERARSLYRELGYRFGEANALHQLGIVCRETGDYSEAADMLEEARSFYHEIDNQSGEARALEALSDLRRHAGENEQG
ncbi:tetratricopeptide repeat protein [Nocardia sp. CS682]|uniref:tetratricopeptide repeat protein n=1 Tax=Nocardia sp. CS682 TaxID=1047172 RepID=UPI0010754B6B|nr:tetratricopeptide repeat protein [Nocardia sp. CS682]QBS41348.1 hypothetical protein DMB37_15665 [Nocardia sp. CS682]